MESLTNFEKFRFWYSKRPTMPSKIGLIKKKKNKAKAISACLLTVLRMFWLWWRHQFIGYYAIPEGWPLQECWTTKFCCSSKWLWYSFLKGQQDQGDLGLKAIQLSSWSFWKPIWDPFGPIWTHLDLLRPSCPIWTHLVPFWKVLTNSDPFRPILTYLDKFGAIWSSLEPNWLI